MDDISPEMAAKYAYIHQFPAQPMVLRTVGLSRFSVLPMEIQMMIWEYAAIPRGCLDLHKVFNGLALLCRDNLEKEFFAALSTKKLPTLAWISDPDAWAEVKSSFQTTAHRRAKLMRICSLSRQTMLEVWKKDVLAAIELFRADDIPLESDIEAGIRIVERLDKRLVDMKHSDH